ncbi:MAG: ABC transporter ATP-binding protein [Anaerolineae bacterium]|nr:ABC transporter ATP-binding protein [Anaerolineae bacterium]
MVMDNNNNNNNDLLLEVKDLRVSFPLDEGMVRAVEGVDLSIKPRQVMGVVGESGCGKTVTAQSIMRIIPRPGRIDAGQILFHRSEDRSRYGTIDMIDLAQLNPTGRQIRGIRGKEIAMIFQEPMSSFSPLHTIGNQVMEAILLHQDVDKTQARAMTIEMLDRVGIPDSAQRVDQYAHEFSGGMRQRAMIAMALSCNPALLIADEPTTALDVTIQAQILNLMRDLQQEFGMAIMFITHNLGVIAQIADEVAIMYLGRVVEHGSVREIFHNPQHPYTFNLLRAIPCIGKTSGQRLVSIQGVVPSPFERPPGCAFHPRCEQMIAGRCDVDVPSVTRLENDHTVACFLYEQGE